MRITLLPVIALASVCACAQGGATDAGATTAGAASDFGASPLPDDTVSISPNAPDETSVRVFPSPVRVHTLTGQASSLSIQFWKPNTPPLVLSPQITDLVDPKRGRTLRTAETAFHGRLDGWRGDWTWPLPASEAGTYKGFVVLNRSDPTKETWVPIELTVRDPVEYALGCLLIGVGIFLGLTRYRASRMEEDALYVRIDRIASLIQADSELARGRPGERFGTAIVANLTQASGAVATGTDNTVAELLRAAMEIWDRWVAEREGWIQLLGRIDVLRKSLRGAISAEPDATHPAQLLEALNHEDPATKPSDESAGPSPLADFRSQTAETVERADRYLRIRRLLTEAASRAAQIGNTAKAKDLGDRIALLKATWNGLDPRKEEYASAAEETARSAEATFNELSGPLPESSEAGGEGRAPSPLPKWVVVNIRKAHRNRLAYGIALGLVTFSGLAMEGLKAAYNAKPDFGADRLQDYLGLAVWIFGAEAASMAVVTAITANWSLPFLKSQSGADSGAGAV